MAPSSIDTFALPGPPRAVAMARQLITQGDPRAASVVAEAALAREGAHADLHAVLADAQAGLGRLDRAARNLRAALELAPDRAGLHTSLAQLLRSLGQGEEASAHFERACQLEPGNGQAQLLWLLHRGNLCDEQGRPEEARELFVQAATEFPESADAWAMLGVMHTGLGAPDLAADALARALQIDPSRIHVMEYFASALMSLKRFEEAALVYERMLQLEPRRPLLAGWLLHTKYLMGDWFRLDRLQGQVVAELAAGRPASEPFGLQGWCADPAFLKQAAVAQAARKHPPRPGYLAPPVIGRGPRIRVGYLAGEFRQQATSVLLTEVLELHDRERFEVFAFDNGWDDSSPRRQRINAACQVVPIRGISDLDAARRVREQGIDILVNLNGYFGLARTNVFAMRPAPLQVNYLGFPGTIGADYIDYLVADATVIPPEARGHYVEQVVYLPDSYQPNDSTRVVADAPASREEAGLPEGAFVFCCLNNAYKILPAVYDVWMRLLQQVPRSVLLLYGDKPEQIANLHHEAQQRGVDPQRVRFAPPLGHAEHLRRLQLCDLFLDTWPYNAHTTGSDALWAGLPVLTCTGQSFPSRVGASLLQAVGLPELVTHDMASYEALALRLAHEPGLLAGLRARLQAQRPQSALYDTVRYTRHLEDAFGQMVQRARDGLAPASFAVQRRPA